MPPGAAPFFRTKRPLTLVTRVELRCPRCGRFHVDREEWTWRPHHTHLCEHCDHEFDAGEGHIYFSGKHPDSIRGLARLAVHKIEDVLASLITFR